MLATRRPWCTRSLVSSLLRAPLRRHWNGARGISPLFERAASCSRHCHGGTAELACVPPSIVPFLYSKRTAMTRSPGSRYGRSNVLWPLRDHHSWNNPDRGGCMQYGGNEQPQSTEGFFKRGDNKPTSRRGGPYTSDSANAPLKAYTKGSFSAHVLRIGTRRYQPEKR